MATNNTQKELIRLRRSVMNPDNTPKTRLSNAKTMVLDFGFTDRNLRIAKRVAKIVLKDPEADRTARYAATNLLLLCENQRVTEEDENETEGLPDEAPEIASKRPPIMTLSRAEQLAKANAKWDGVTGPDGVCVEPPQKFLHYFEAADLIPFGVDDLESPDSHYYAPFGESEASLSFAFKRIVNPKYLDALKAWKQQRLNGEIPGRDSIWYGLWEDTIGAGTLDRTGNRFDPNPATYRGVNLLRYMVAEKQLAKWEIPFTIDLFYEIYLCGPGSRHANDSEFKQNFIWTE